MHIGIDVDGVLRKLIHSLRREYLKDYPEQEANIVSADNLEYWDIRKLAPGDELGLGKELEVYCLEQPKTSYRCFRNADVVEDSIREMGKLYHDASFNDHVVSICTSQYHPWQKEATTEWLHEYNVPFDNVIMTGSGKGHFGLDMLFDDRVKNCVAVEQDGGTGVVRERAYNKGARSRVSASAGSVDEFRKIMLSQS
jgi:5'(3')-deoxyribonucleotidase